MSKRIFTKEQIADLCNNPNVASCDGRVIVYSRDFKIRAIRQCEERMAHKEIFRQAGFDLEAIGQSSPKDRLKEWRKTFQLKGISGLERETRGRPVRPKDEGDRIKYLEAEVAYLKAENDFLAKLRARRAEQNSGQKKNTN